ncbi:probable NADP-dependent mannitol dehydrogenase [Trichomonascus vanleenenianus]|uniref:putative NADP-dependent mannitol dehydrogenase n=1 Tax=Trichomonascus vanleenenianus TaxID=2268995 RepID=UPI003ECAF5F4
MPQSNVLRWIGDQTQLSPEEKALRRFNLSGRRAVITGGGGSLGLEMAFALLEHGCEAIHLIDIDRSRLYDAVRRLMLVFPQRSIEEAVVDITNKPELEKFIADGPLEGNFDIVIALAGIAMPKEIHSDADWDSVIDTNVTGSFNTVKLFGELMIKSHTPGSIVIVSSLAGHHPQSAPVTQTTYSSPKAALLNMMRFFAAEWAQYHIRVNSISPGYMSAALTGGLVEPPEVWYERIPMQRIGERGELDGAIILLVSNAGSYITGTDIVVDGGAGALN